MSFYPASSRIASASGLFAVWLLAGLSACQHPVAQFQRSNREVFYSPTPKLSSSSKPTANVPADSTGSSPGNVPGGSERAPQAVVYAEDSRPVESAGKSASQPIRNAYPAIERIRQHQTNARRLLSPVSEASSDKPTPVSEHQPGPKPKKTLREILGLPPRKKLNWWQRISWQLKASVVVILVAVVFAILNITILAIVFGIIGAFLLIRGLKKSFKVRRGIFGLGR